MKNQYEAIGAMYCNVDGENKFRPRYNFKRFEYDGIIVCGVEPYCPASKCYVLSRYGMGSQIAMLGSADYDRIGQQIMEYFGLKSREKYNIINGYVVPKPVESDNGGVQWVALKSGIFDKILMNSDEMFISFRSGVVFNLRSDAKLYQKAMGWSE